MCSVKFKILIFTSLFFFSIIDYAYSGTNLSNREKQMNEEESTLKAASELVELSRLRTINDYLKTGLDRNPALKAAFYEWKMAYSKIAQEFSLPDPQFSFTEYVKSVDMKNAFSVEQMFPLPDKIWIKKNRAVKNSEMAYYNFEKARLFLITKISEAYYEYAYLSKSILITRETMKLLESFENVAQSKYASGLTQNQDLLKVQLELGKLENDLLIMEDMRKPIMAGLTALLNLPENAELPWSDESLEEIKNDENFQHTEKILEELKNKNPELLAAIEKVGREEAGLKLARRGYFPDLTAEFTQETMPDDMTGDDINQSMVMFSINVPIWFNRTQAEIEDARASLNAAENERDNLKNQLLSELAMSQYKLRNAVRQSNLYKNALIPKAVQALNAAKSAYESGGIDFLSLVEAQRELLTFQLNYYRQNADYHQRLAELKALIGKLEVDVNK